MTTELGVYDNYPIHLKRDIEQVKLDLVERGYLLQPPVTLSKGLAELYAGVTFYQYYSSDRTVWFEIETPKEKSEYLTTIMLHPADEIKGIRPKDISRVILDLGGYIKEKMIPACFPKSGGWNHPKDASKIVYYNP